MIKYFYFYYSTLEKQRQEESEPKNQDLKQAGQITLVSIDQFQCCKLFLRDLEGILTTEKQIPFSEQSFPESKKSKIEEIYQGKFDYFKNYR